METTAKKRHSLLIAERKGGTVEGASEVLSFSDSELLILTSEGKLRILGKGMKISAFNNAAGTLTFSGEINEVKYLAAPKPLLSKIFK